MAAFKRGLFGGAQNVYYMEHKEWAEQGLDRFGRTSTRLPMEENGQGRQEMQGGSKASTGHGIAWKALGQLPHTSDRNRDPDGHYSRFGS